MRGIDPIDATQSYCSHGGRPDGCGPMSADGLLSTVTASVPPHGETEERRSLKQSISAAGGPTAGRMSLCMQETGGDVSWCGHLGSGRWRRPLRLALHRWQRGHRLGDSRSPWSQLLPRLAAWSSGSTVRTVPAATEVMAGWGWTWDGTDTIAVRSILAHQNPREPNRPPRTKARGSARGPGCLSHGRTPLGLAPRRKRQA